LLDEQLVAVGALRAGVAFLVEDADGVEDIVRRGAEVVAGVAQPEHPVCAVGDLAEAVAPGVGGVPAVGAQQGQAVDPDAHALPVFAARGARGVEDVLGRAGIVVVGAHEREQRDDFRRGQAVVGGDQRDGEVKVRLVAVHFIDVPLAPVEEAGLGRDGNEVALAEGVAGERVVVEPRDFGQPLAIAIAEGIIAGRTPGRVVLAHPAEGAAAVARRGGLHHDLPFAAHGADVGRLEIGRRVQHFVRVGEQNALHRERVGGRPGALADGVDGLQVGVGFRERGRGRQQRGQGQCAPPAGAGRRPGRGGRFVWFGC